MQALERWERTLDTILAGRRRRLSGAEYIALIDEVERAGDAREVQKIALRLAEKLARHDGATGQARFGDPAMTRAYDAAKKQSDAERPASESLPTAVSPAAHQVASDRRRDLRPRPV